ncbi:MAG: hypothetical protein JEZ07_01640 [Phycisphaerae bacterium]|nr:hypothetical protein [Phycisphaerae bacterium]
MRLFFSRKYCLAILLPFLFWAIISVGFRVIVSNLEYKAGYYGEAKWLVKGSFLGMFCVVLLLGLVICAIWLIVKNISCKRFAFVYVMIISFSIGWLADLSFSNIYYNPSASLLGGLSDRLDNNVPLGDIRKWLVQSDWEQLKFGNSVGDSNWFMTDISKQAFPFEAEGMTMPRYKYIWINNNNRYVHFVWGGGMSHWGMIIADSEDITDFDYLIQYFDFYEVKILDGVLLFKEDN